MDVKVKELVKEQSKVEDEIFDYSIKLLRPFYENRHEVISKIPRFWPTVIDTCELLSDYLTYEDTEAIETLEDIYITWMNRDFNIEFVFGENNFMPSQKVLKSMKYDAENEEYTSEPVQISWKPNRDLTLERAGRDKSFFSWFAYSKDGEGSEIARILSEELYPPALQFWLEAEKEQESEWELSDSSEST